MSFQVSHAQGELLAQIQPGVTTPVTLVSAVELRLEVTLILAPVIPGGGDTTAITLYHDDTGTTYNNGTLIGNVTNAEAADDVLFQAQHPGSGIHIKPGGSLGVATSVASNVTISVYGITETLAERVRGT